MSAGAAAPVTGPVTMESDPIFLSQLFQMHLPEISSLQAQEVNGTSKDAATRYPTDPAYAPLTTPPIVADKAPVTLEAWQEFPQLVAEAVAGMSSSEAYNHVLPPASFRAGDLPKAVMLPTVHLWLIVNAWQPINRVFALEDELSIGGSTGGLPYALQMGDHLPRHDTLPYSVPRQVIYREGENGIRGVIYCREPWLVSEESLYESDGSPRSLDSLKGETKSGISEMAAFMRVSGVNYGIFTTYRFFTFARLDHATGQLHLSPPIQSNSSRPTVFSSLWYFAREIVVAK